MPEMLVLKWDQLAGIRCVGHSFALPLSMDEWGLVSECYGCIADWAEAIVGRL
jgi:hypothetical protein